MKINKLLTEFTCLHILPSWKKAFIIILLLYCLQHAFCVRDPRHEDYFPRSWTYYSAPPKTGLQQLWDIPQNTPGFDKEIVIEISPLESKAESLVILTPQSSMLYNSEFLVKCITENWTNLVPSANYAWRRDCNFVRKPNSKTEYQAMVNTKNWHLKCFANSSQFHYGTTEFCSLH